MSGDQNYFLRDIQPPVFGITQILSHYRNALAEFDPVFHDDRNRSSFSPFVSTLIFADNQWTIAALERA